MADVTLTVSSDKGVALNVGFFAVQGEETVVAVTAFASDYDAYVDFLTQDGVAVWRGPFDCSTGGFEFTLESDDAIIQVDGVLIWQFVLAETEVDGSRDIKWLSRQNTTRILSSVSAQGE